MKLEYYHPVLKFIGLNLNLLRMEDIIIAQQMNLYS